MVQSESETGQELPGTNWIIIHQGPERLACPDRLDTVGRLQGEAALVWKILGAASGFSNFSVAR